MFKRAGFTPASNKPAALAEIEDACCEICNYNGGKESLNSEPPYPDMYICDVCHRTYHWSCMKEIGCYTDAQRQIFLQKQEIDNNNYWACPACAPLSEDEKLIRANSFSNEVARIDWEPSWEPEDIKEAWPNFHQCIIKFEAHKADPDLRGPPFWLLTLS
eukprot:408589-Pelagomonas_calceolata.AAC.1